MLKLVNVSTFYGSVPVLQEEPSFQKALAPSLLGNTPLTQIANFLLALSAKPQGLPGHQLSCDRYR